MAKGTNRLDIINEKEIQIQYQKFKRRLCAVVTIALRIPTEFRWECVGVDREQK